MPISYRNELPHKDQFFALFQTTGWNDHYYFFTAEELEKAIQNSWFTLCAYDQDQLVGFGRIISDGQFHALIVEMIVLPEYQGQGIGSHILEVLMGQCKSAKIRDIQLFCARGKEGFYKKFGFKRRPEDGPGMEIKMSYDR